MASDYKIYADVQQLLVLLNARETAEEAKSYADYLQEKVGYQVGSYNQVPLQAAIKRLTDKSDNSAHLQDTYDQLKLKNVQDLDACVSVLALLSKDKETKRYFEDHCKLRRRSSNLKSRASTMLTADSVDSNPSPSPMQSRSPVAFHPPVPPKPAQKSGCQEIKANIAISLKSKAADHGLNIHERPSRKKEHVIFPHVGFSPATRKFSTYDYVVDEQTQDYLMRWSVGAIGNIPVASQENRILDDLLSILSGISGDYIHPQALIGQTDDRLFVIDNTLDLAMKQLVERILPTCSNYSLVVRYTERNIAFEYGKVNHALIASIETLIMDHLMLVAQMEQLFLEQKLTLRKLWVYLQPSIAIFDLLANLVNSINKGNLIGGSVLSLLHLKTCSLTGDSKMQELCFNLTKDACVPFFAILEEWVYRGIVKDTFGEFLIADNYFLNKEDAPTAYNNEYWEKRYEMRRDKIPAFLERVADMIMNTGKYLNVIRECGREIDCASLEAGSLVYNISERSYVSKIETLYHRASQMLLDILVVDYDLVGRLKSVKFYFLMAQGDFIVQLMDTTESELRKQIADINPSRLESLLELAIRTSGANTDPYKDDVRTALLPFDLINQMSRITNNPDGIDCEPRMYFDDGMRLSGMEAFTFTYEVTWPVSLVLGQKFMACYQMLFRHLFYSKHVERLLCKLWMSNRVSKLFSMVDSRNYSASFALCQRMLNFIQNLEYYMMFEVIEPCWQTFMDNLKKVKNVDEVLLRHNDFLLQCMTNCMVQNPVLLRIITDLMSTCVHFSKFMIKMRKYFIDAELSFMSDASVEETETSDSAESPDNMDEASEQNTSFVNRITKFDKDFTRLLISLLDHVSDHSKVEYNDKLVNILYRLDFNGFYTEDLERSQVERSLTASVNSHNNQRL